MEFLWFQCLDYEYFLVFFSSLTVNGIYLGFGQLVGQNIWSRYLKLWKLAMWFLTICWYLTKLIHGNTHTIFYGVRNQIPIPVHYSPVLSRAPRIQSWYMELSMLSSGGGSMKWKRSKSCTPRDFKSRTTLARLVLWISGMVVVSISFL